MKHNYANMLNPVDRQDAGNAKAKTGKLRAMSTFHYLLGARYEKAFEHPERQPVSNIYKNTSVNGVHYSCAVLLVARWRN